jgi:hypothetical protein
VTHYLILNYFEWQNLYTLRWHQYYYWKSWTVQESHYGFTIVRSILFSFGFFSASTFGEVITLKSCVQHLAVDWKSNNQCTLNGVWFQFPSYFRVNRIICIRKKQKRWVNVIKRFITFWFLVYHIKLIEYKIDITFIRTREGGKTISAYYFSFLVEHEENKTCLRIHWNIVYRYV